MYHDRLADYKELEERRESRLLVYITSDRRHMNTQIAQDVLPLIIDHVDSFQLPHKITLYLYTRGGDTLTAWRLVNLIRMFCDEFEVIVPVNAHSAGTLICLGADRIIMTKQATLGPIDPSVNGPLNPQIPFAPPGTTSPVSVEAINGFIELAKKELGNENGAGTTQLLLKLADVVHPLVLGDVYRAQAQIKMLAKKLLAYQVTEEETITKVISFLCSESGSHDYTINRREASQNLGLNIEKPDGELYLIIKNIYNDISNELQLTNPYEPATFLSGAQQNQYSFHRGLIESISCGSHFFLTEGTLKKEVIQTPGGPQTRINDERIYDGWRFMK